MAKTKKQRTGLRIHEVGPDNDARFISVFSYRHLRIIGWAFMALAQLGLILGLFANSTQNGAMGTASSVLKFFSGLMPPLFLIAAFAQVLTAKNGYRKLIFLYVGGAIGIFLAFLLVFYHYIVGIVSILSGPDASAADAAASILGAVSGGGFFAFNVFIDLALCALLTFFLNYHPKEHFQGKWIYLFRAFAALPILYEIGSITLKILSSYGMLTIHPVVFPLLTTKPPFGFLIFVALAFFVKFRERHFTKHGKTLEDYQVFLDTNLNRKQVSRFLILCIIISSVLDLVTIVLVSAGVASANPLIDTQADAAINDAVKMASSWGLGGCFLMLLIVPLVAFFDYRKTYENKIVDTLIPLAGIAVIAVILLEGMFLYARLSLNELINQPEESSSTQSDLLLRGVKRVFEVFRE